MNNLFIPILLGTARSNRQSAKAAAFVAETAQRYGRFSTELIDVGDFVAVGKTAAMAKEKSAQWSGTMERADGLIIVVPEYNHGYPGELKLMLDEIYAEYNRKPAAICGVSKGSLGGARVTEVLRLALIELQMVPIRNAVYFANVENLFDESGRIKDESYADRLKNMFDELVWYAVALKVQREADKRVG